MTSNFIILGSQAQNEPAFPLYTLNSLQSFWKPAHFHKQFRGFCISYLLIFL